MGFYIKHGDTTSQIYFDSAKKGVSPNTNNFLKLWVEPFGIPSHYSVPVRYVTGNSSTGNQTTWEVKDLYYYPTSSEKLSTTSTTSITSTKTSSNSTNINGSNNAGSSTSLKNSGYLEAYSVNQSIGDSTGTIYMRKTVGDIIDCFPSLFNNWATNSSSTTYYLKGPDSTVSNWAGSRNGSFEDTWTTTSNPSFTNIETSTYSITKTYNIPIITNTSLTCSITSINCYFRFNLVELFHGDVITYGTSGYQINPEDSAHASYRLSTSSPYNLALNTFTTTKTFSISPVFNKAGSSITCKPITVKATLSGTSITLEITSPYAFQSLEGVNYTYCGYTTQLDIVDFTYDYQTTTTASTTTVNGNLIQYNNSLHRCFFSSPRDETGQYIGTMQCYSMYMPAVDNSFYAALAQQSAIGLVINPYYYSVASGQSAAYLNNKEYVQCSLSQFNSSSNYRTRISHISPVYYLNPWYDAGSTSSDFFSTYDTFTKLYDTFKMDATLLVKKSSSAPSSLSDYYNLATQSNTLYIISADTLATVKSFPVTTYNLQLYAYRLNNNYFYNYIPYNTTFVLTSLSGADSYTIRYINTSGVWTTLTSVSNTSIVLPANSGYLYFTASSTPTIKYSAYKTTSTCNAYLKLTYPETYSHANYSWSQGSASLSYSYSKTSPSACVGVGAYCYSQLTYSNSWGTSSGSYTKSLSTSYTSSSVSSLSYTGTSSNVYNGTMYFKLSATIDTTSGRYNHRYCLYRAYNYTGGNSDWSLVSVGTYYNPKYQQRSMGSYTDYWNASTSQYTYWYYWGEQTTEISYPDITNCADNGSYKRKITVKNSNSFSVTVYYTSNKCTSKTSIDSGATWAYGTSISAYGTATLYVTDRSGFSDAYIAVGIDCGSGMYAINWYSEAVSSSPSWQNYAYQSV